MSRNIYEMMLDRIIEQFENRIIPREKFWTETFEEAFNKISKHIYALNQMLLSKSDKYATFKKGKG